MKKSHSIEAHLHCETITTSIVCGNKTKRYQFISYQFILPNLAKLEASIVVKEVSVQNLFKIGRKLRVAKEAKNLVFANWKQTIFVWNKLIKTYSFISSEVAKFLIVNC